MIVVNPAPGYVLGRQSADSEERTAGGIILPAGTNHRPVLRIVADGGPPLWDPDGPLREDWHRTPNTPFTIEEGVQVVVAGVDQMIEIGIDRLWLVPYAAIVASLEERHDAF